MKKLLPTSTSLSVNKTKYNPQGFTLIELLVVIAIIAILSIVGIALFTGTQSKARDSRRVQDITAMSKAMEVNYVAGNGYSTALQASWFADGATPTNPTPNGTTYFVNTITTASYTFCALLEASPYIGNSSTGTTFTASTGGQYYCRRNNQ